MPKNTISTLSNKTNKNNLKKNSFPLPLVLGFFLFIISLGILVKFRSNLSQEKTPELYPLNPSFNEVKVSLYTPVDTANINSNLPISIRVEDAPSSKAISAFAFVVKVPKPLKIVGNVQNEIESAFPKAKFKNAYVEDKGDYSLYQVAVVYVYDSNTPASDKLYLTPKTNLLTFNVTSEAEVDNAPFEFVTIDSTGVPNVLDSKQNEILSQSYKDSSLSVSFVKPLNITPANIKLDLRETPNAINADNTYNEPLTVFLENTTPGANLSYCISETNNCPLGWATYKGPFKVYPNVSFKSENSNPVNIKGPTIYVSARAQKGSELNNVVSFKELVFKVSDVKLSPPPGKYTGPINVKAFTNTPGAAIRYGKFVVGENAAPTKDFPAKGLTLNKDAKFFVIASKEGYKEGKLSNVVYTIVPSELPKVSFIEPYPGDTFVVGESIPVEVKVLSSENISTVTLYANDKKVASLTKPTDSLASIYSFKYTPKVAGKLAFKAVARTNSGKGSSALVNVKVEDSVSADLSFNFSSPKKTDKFVYLKDTFKVVLTNVTGSPTNLIGILGENYEFPLNKKTYVFAIPFRDIRLENLKTGYNRLSVTISRGSGPNSTYTKTMSVFIYTGDINEDNKVNVSDLVALLNYVVSGSSKPVADKNGGNQNGAPDLVKYDANMDGVVNLFDILAFINILF